MQLNELKDNEGARKDRMRVGRGIGSGKGKTCGRGVKGQKSRSGVSINGFEGGQMPLYRRLPKFGFNNPTRKNWTEVNIGRIQSAIDAGKLDAKTPITEESLQKAGVVRRIGDGVRLLGEGKLDAKIDITLSGATKSAREAVEAKAGSVTIIEVKENRTAQTGKTGKRTARRLAAAEKRASRI